MTFFGLGLQSCGDEDEEDKIVKQNSNDTTKTNNGDDNPIIGTWKVVNIKMVVNGQSQTINYDNFTYIVWKFTEDQTICTSYSEGKAQYTTQGRYKLDGNQIVGLDHADMSTMLYELRGDTLILENTSSAEYRQVFKCLPYGKEIDIVDGGNNNQTTDAYETLNGTWTMTIALHSGYEDYSQNGMMVASDNYYFTLKFSEDKSFETTMCLGGEAITGSGTFSLEKSVLTLKFDNDAFADEVFTIISFENSEIVLMKTQGSATSMFSFSKTAK